MINIKIKVPKLSIDQKDHVISACLLILVGCVMAQYYIKNPFWVVFVNTTTLVVIIIVSSLYRSFFNKFQIFKAQPILAAKINEMTDKEKEYIRKIAEFEMELKRIREGEKK